MKRLLALSLALLPALGQEYRALPGADTGRPDLDRSYALVYPAPRPKALLLLVPGLLGGSTNFALLAERLRAMAPGPASGPGRGGRTVWRTAGASSGRTPWPTTVPSPSPTSPL